MQIEPINALLKISLMFSITVFSNNVLAEEQPPEPAEDSSGWFALTVENDAFGVLDTSDDGYSNGISLSWGYDKVDGYDSIKIPDWIRKLTQATYLNQGDDNSYAISYGAAQGMYTPADIEEEELIVDKDVLKKMYVLRRILNPMGTVDAIEFLLDKLRQTDGNSDFFDSMNT